MIVLAKILAFILANPKLVAAGVIGLFELIFRRKPTEKDYSIVNFIKRVIDSLAPNQAANGAKHK